MSSGLKLKNYILILSGLIVFFTALLYFFTNTGKAVLLLGAEPAKERWYMDPEIEKQGINRFVLFKTGELVFGNIRYEREDNEFIFKTRFGKYKLYRQDVKAVFTREDTASYKTLNKCLQNLTKYQAALQDYMKMEHISRIDTSQPVNHIMLTYRFFNTIPVCPDAGKYEIYDTDIPLARCSLHGTIRNIKNNLVSIFRSYE